MLIILIKKLKNECINLVSFIFPSSHAFPFKEINNSIEQYFPPIPFNLILTASHLIFIYRVTTRDYHAFRILLIENS